MVISHASARVRSFVCVYGGDEAHTYIQRDLGGGRRGYVTVISYSQNAQARVCVYVQRGCVKDDRDDESGPLKV